MEIINLSKSMNWAWGMRDWLNLPVMLPQSEQPQPEEVFPTEIELWASLDKAYEDFNNQNAQIPDGEQMARALMQEPGLLLADEPVASLDPALAHSIMRHLQLINREDKITVLVSLHFLDLVQQYSTRAIALNEGRLVFDGSPEEIDDDKFIEIYGQEAERIG